MPARLVSAALTFDAAGTPYSPEYGDIYHSAESGPGQARHVFLGGNGLPSNWAGARIFTIVETGFGLGVNFLSTWRAWRDDPARCERLHFVSVEKHPFDAASLAALHERYADLAPFAAQLRGAWPLLVPGMHRLHFERGRITLTLAFGDVADALPQLRLAADAIFLDGFSPEKNPAMWTPKAIKAIARLSRPGATLSTYTAARSVCDALAAAGFSVEKRPGYGRKRDMLAAKYEPRWKMRHAPAAPPAWPERRAVVIGAGLAGAAAGERLAARGWQVELIERHSAPAAEASGLHAGAFHPHVSRDDAVLSRLSRAGFLHALERWQALEAAGHALSWQRCGLLQLATNAAGETHMAQTMAELACPAAYAQYVPRERASELAGQGLRAGGWWFPAGGWIRPAGLVAAQIAAETGIATHFGKSVHALAHVGDHWQAIDANGAVIASAPVVVLANSHDVARLAPLSEPLARSRGQLSYLPALALPSVRAVLTGNAYLLPDIEGLTVAGTTYDFEDEDVEPRASGHADVLARVAQLLEKDIAALETGKLAGAVGFRCVAPDRMPLMGALPDLATARSRGKELAGAHLSDFPRLPGMYAVSGYASRGLIWAALGGELVASLIEGEPLPVEGKLADAVDPGRFAVKLARRGRL